MRILPRWSDEERFIESRGREIERPPSWRDGWTERESEREGGGRLTRCVWAVSLRHQLDGRSKECAHACTRCSERVCALHAPTRIVHCVPLEPVASQRWPSPRRDEERRGEAKRGEARRGEVGKRQKRRGRPTARTRARAHSPSRVLGPRQLTSDGRKSFYVFIHRSFLPDRYPPSTSPFVASLSRGWDRFEDYRVSCEPARICRSTYWSRFEEIVVRI